MRKLREEKGFAMAELLAVCIVVLGIFAILFSNYLPLTAEYENRVTYNNVNAEYAATYIRKAFKDVRIVSNISSSDIGKSTLEKLDSNTPGSGYVTLYKCYSSSCNTDTLDKVFGGDDATEEQLNQLNTIKKLINEYGIQEIILTKYKTDNVKVGYSKGDALYNYIESLSSFSDSKVTKTGKYRIILKTKDYGYATVPLRYSEVNEPKLASNMLPVYYDNGSWKVADKTNESVTHEWYDYVDKKWANAVILNSGCNTSVGSDVTSCIKSMWVWIPKYKYEEINSKTAKQIDVTFITQDNKNDTPHPAFGGKGSTTTGFWIGKYESNGNIIKAGESLKGSSSPSVASGSTRITNYEWGAVAYLAFSKYGTCDKNGENCRVEKNVTTITGRGNTGYPVYESSTTHNYYGVFDMSGGRYELIANYGFRGDGTATGEVDADNKVTHKYDHKFKCENCGGWCETIKHAHYYSYSYSCGTKENPKTCSGTGVYYTYTYSWHQDKDLIENTSAPYKIVGGSGTNCSPIRTVSLDKKTAIGYTFHSWHTDMNKADDQCSSKYDLRGGGYDGNAWCIATTVDNTSPSASSSSAKDDTKEYHYGVLSNTNVSSYTGIFAYSSSSFVKSDYIVTRSVIK